MKFLTYFLVYAISIFYANAQNDCKTPVNESGQCVPVKTCSIIIDILTNSPKPLAQRVLDYLQKSRCSNPNNQPHVCCAPRHITADSATSNKNDNIILSYNDVDGPDDVSNHPNLRLHPLNECGDLSNRRISNGNSTKFGELPWMALLEYDVPDDLKFRCGGSLISSRYVLTAAHCVTGISTPLISVRLGEHDMSTEKDCVTIKNRTTCAPPVQNIEVEEIRSHPNYNKPRFSNDIALIRLKKDAEFVDDSVMPICLPINAETQNLVLEKVIISGWGLTENKIISNKLLKAFVTVLPNDDCIKEFGSIAQITSTQMCAGGDTGVDSCQGDSGGPLVNQGNVRGIRYVQYGVISAGGAICGTEEKRPGIYTRVSHYMKWILDQMRP